MTTPTPRPTPVPAVCRRMHRRIDDLAAGELDARQTAELEAHLDGCPGCRRRSEELTGTVALVRRGFAEELPPDFGAALHRKLAQAGRPDPPGLWARFARLAWLRPLVYTAAGAAAAVVVMVLVGRGASPAAAPAPMVAAARPTPSGEVAPTYHVPARKLAVVRINFAADTPVDDVEFAVTLPEGLHFVSGGEELPDREFRWRGRLEQGANVVPIAVRGGQAGLYTVAARVSGEGIDAIERVVLEVTSS